MAIDLRKNSTGNYREVNIAAQTLSQLPPVSQTQTLLSQLINAWDFNFACNECRFDPDKRINHTSTLLTNFGINRLQHFRKAVKEYNQKHDGEFLVISPYAYGAGGLEMDDLLSLHTLRRGRGLSDFWRRYDEIVAENK